MHTKLRDSIDQSCGERVVSAEEYGAVEGPATEFIDGAFPVALYVVLKGRVSPISRRWSPDRQSCCC